MKDYYSSKAGRYTYAEVGKNRKYEKQVQQKKAKYCLYAFCCAVAIVALVLLFSKSNFFALQSFGFLNPDNRADFPSNSNVGRRRTEGGDDQRQDNDMEQGQGALKSRVRGSKNVVVDQLIKMQEQQTNKVNVRLRNIESAISEIKTKSTKYDRLLEELSKKLQEHDMSITKLTTASVIGSRDEHRNKNGNEPQLPSSKTFSKKQLEVIEATKHSWVAYEKYGFGGMKSNQSANLSTWFNIGLTLVDSLDTLLLMGLNEVKSKEWVATA